jgi:hypothetical protein
MMNRTKKVSKRLRKFLGLWWIEPIEETLKERGIVPYRHFPQGPAQVLIDPRCPGFRQGSSLHQANQLVVRVVVPLPACIARTVFPGVGIGLLGPNGAEDFRWPPREVTARHHPRSSACGAPLGASVQGT